VARAIDPGRQIVRPALIEVGIAGMIDRSDDEAGIGERLGRIVMADEVAAPAMRDDDERQPVAGDRTILRPRKGYSAEVDLSRRLGAGIPHRSVEGGTSSV